MRNNEKHRRETRKNKTLKHRIWLVALVLIGILLVAVICLFAGNIEVSKSDTAFETNSESVEGTEEEIALNAEEEANFDAEEEADLDTEEEAALNAEEEADLDVEEDTEVTDSEDELETQVSAPYEHWLAAAVVSGISMLYPDFESVSCYAAGETILSEANTSAGIYVTFISGDEQICIFSSPLTEERNDAGTMDIYSEVTGYASFDVVSQEDIPEEYTEISIDNMNELITQSVRIMLCEH